MQASDCKQFGCSKGIGKDAHVSKPQTGRSKHFAFFGAQEGGDRRRFAEEQSFSPDSCVLLITETIARDKDMQTRSKEVSQSEKMALS